MVCISLKVNPLLTNDFVCKVCSFACSAVFSFHRFQQWFTLAQSEFGTVLRTCWKTQVGAPKLKAHRRKCIPIVSGCFRRSGRWDVVLAAQDCRACWTSFGLWNVCCSESQCYAKRELPQKLDGEWPESIFHHVGSQSASYLLSVQCEVLSRVS